MLGGKLFVLKLSNIKSQNPEITNQLIELDESLAKCGRHRIDIRELTIAQIREHFQMGRLSSVELTQCYLDRISQIDVYLRSVIEVNPEAITLARQADADRIAGYDELCRIERFHSTQFTI